MKIYRLTLRESGTQADGETYEAPPSATFGGQTVHAGECLFVKTGKAINVDKLYERDHICAKEYPEVPEDLPDDVSVVDLTSKSSG